MMNFMPSSPGARNSTCKKATKLRATCDACKDAKVRCNRDVPTCYRCRNQKLRCVYNLSRRMGRPRRNNNDADSAGARPEDEQDKAQEPTRSGNDVRQVETTGAEPASFRGDPCGEQAQEHENRHSTIDSKDQIDHSTASSSSDAGIRNSSSISSLMDIFGNTDDYDMNQFQTTTVIPDLDEMAGFEFSDGLGASIPPESLPASPPRTSYWTRPQGVSVPGGGSIREQVNSSRPLPQVPKVTSLSESSAATITDGNMMLMDGLDERPFLRLESTFDLEQMQAQGTSGHKLPSAGSKQGENRAVSSHSATCECYDILVQKLSIIDEKQSDIFSSTIDVALIVEQGIQGRITKVLECGMCATRRPTILLLVAIIMDNVVCMLENSSKFGNSKSLVENNSCHHTSKTSNPSEAQPAFRTPQAADDIAAGNSTASPTPTIAANDLALLVGSHEIISEEKNRFLKQLLQGHLSNLSATLRQLMQYMQRSSPQMPNARHGTITVAETYKRLQSIIGRVELWDG